MTMAMPEPAIPSGVAQQIISSINHLFQRLERCEANFTYVSTIRDLVSETKDIVQSRNTEIELLKDKNSLLEKSRSEVARDLEKTSSNMKVLNECLFKIPDIIEMCQVNKNKVDQLSWQSSQEVPKIKTELNDKIEALERKVSGNAAEVFVVKKKLEGSGTVGDAQKFGEALEEFKKETNSQYAKLNGKLELRSGIVTEEMLEEKFNELNKENISRITDVSKLLDSLKAELPKEISNREILQKFVELQKNTDSQYFEITKLYNTLDGKLEIQGGTVDKQTLEQKLSELQEQNNSRIAQVTTQYNSLKLELPRAVVADREILQNEFKEFQNKTTCLLDEITKLYDTLNGKVEHYNGNVDRETLEQKLNKLKEENNSRITNVTKLYDSLKAELPRLIADREALGNKLEEFQKDTNFQFTEVTNLCNTLNGKLEHQSGTLDEEIFEQKLNKLKEENNSKIANVTKLYDSQYTDLTNLYNTISGKFETRGGTVDKETLEEKFNNLQEENNARIANIRKLCDSLNVELPRVVADQEIMKNKFEEFDRQTGFQYIEVTKLYETLSRKLDSLTGTVDKETLEQRLAKLQEENSSQIALVTELYDSLKLQLPRVVADQETIESKLEEFDKKTNSQYTEVLNLYKTLNDKLDTPSCTVEKDTSEKKLKELLEENNSRIDDVTELCESLKNELPRGIADYGIQENKFEEFKAESTVRYRKLHEKLEMLSEMAEYKTLKKMFEDFQTENEFQIKELQKQVDVMTLSFDDCRTRCEESSKQNSSSAEDSGLQNPDRNILNEINNVQQMGEDLNTCIQNELKDVDITVAEMKVLQQKLVKDVEDNREDIRDIRDKNRMIYKKLKDAKEETKCISELERKVRDLKEDLKDVIQMNRDLKTEFNTQRNKDALNETKLHMEIKEDVSNILKGKFKALEVDCISRIKDLQDTDINALQQKISRLDIDTHSKFVEANKKICDCQKEIEGMFKTKGDNNTQLQKVTECIEMVISCQNLAFGNKKSLDGIQKEFLSLKDIFVTKQDMEGLQHEFRLGKESFATKNDLGSLQNELQLCAVEHKRNMENLDKTATELKDLIIEKDKLGANKLESLKQLTNEDMNQMKQKLIQLETEFENHNNTMKTIHASLLNQLEQHEKTAKDVLDSLGKSDDALNSLSKTTIQINEQVTSNKNDITHMKDSLVAESKQDNERLKEHLLKEIDEIRLGKILSADKYQDDCAVVQLLHKVLRSLKDSVNDLKEDNTENKGQVENLTERCDEIVKQMIGMNDSCKKFEIAIQELKKVKPSSSKTSSRASSYAGTSRENSVGITEEDQGEIENVVVDGDDVAVRPTSIGRLNWNFF